MENKGMIVYEIAVILVAYDSPIRRLNIMIVEYFSCERSFKLNNTTQDSKKTNMLSVVLKWAFCMLPAEKVKMKVASTLILFENSCLLIKKIKGIVSRLKKDETSLLVIIKLV